MREGKYEVPYHSKVLNVSKGLISSTGDYFISCNIYNLGENWKVKDKYSFEKVILFHINENGIKEINLELDGRRAIEMNFASDDQGMMTLTGLYSDKMAIGVTGVFYFRYDFAKQKQVNGGFEAFSTYYE